MTENPSPRHPEDPEESSSADGPQASHGSTGSHAAPDKPSSYFSAEPDGSARPYNPAGEYPLPGSPRTQGSQYPGQPGAGQQPQGPQHPGQGGYGAPGQYAGPGYGSPNQYGTPGYGAPHQYGAPNQYGPQGPGAPSPYGAPGGYPGQNFGYPEQKSKIVAGLLGILLGGFGIHRFYLGYTGIGVAQIFVSLITFGFGSLWGFIEGILILVGSQSFRTDARGVPLKE